VLTRNAQDILRGSRMTFNNLIPHRFISALSANPRSVNIRMGLRVIGKNLILLRCNSRSHSRRCSLERSWMVWRPFGKLSGASMGTRSGLTWSMVGSISSLVNATWVCACVPLRMQTPVGRRREPAIVIYKGVGR